MERIHEIGIIHPQSSISKYLTVSVGVATIIPNLNNSLSEFIAHADHALYIAKSNGKNQFHLSTSYKETHQVL